MSRLFLILLSSLCFLVIIGLAACYWHRGWLTIANVKDLFSILASLGGVASLLFIAHQINRQTQLAKASNSQAFVNVASAFVLAVGSNKDLMNFYRTGAANFDTLSEDEKARYRYLVAWWLTFYENVQYQQDCGLLDDGVYKAWMSDMEGFVRRRRVDHVWDEVKANYSDSFITRFQPLVDKIKSESVVAAPPPPPPPTKP